VTPRHAASVRTRLTILSDGTTEACELVFCEGERRSVPVRGCATCPSAGSDSCATANYGLVHCARSVFPIASNGNDLSFPPAAAAALPVGLALARPVVCLEDGLPWIEAARTPLLAHGLYGAPVVDRDGVLLGQLPPAGPASGRQASALDGFALVAEHAVSAVSVHENASLGEAFATMGTRRVREVTVVGDGRRVVGVLRDVDALHFVAHVARTGTRPSDQGPAGAVMT